MQDDSVPLHSEEFQFLKKKIHNISKEKHEQPLKSHAVSLEPMENRLQQCFQVFHDHISDVLDDICSKIPSPLANCENENNVDINLIRQLASFSYTTGVSLRRSRQDLKSYQESNEEDYCFVVDHQEKIVIHEFQDPFVNLLQSSKKESTDVKKILKSRYGDYLEQNGNVLDGMRINKCSYEDPFAVFLRSSGQLTL